MKRGRVKEMLFDDLVESIKEAGKIHRGEMPPSRKFIFAPGDIKAIREGLNKPMVKEALRRASKHDRRSVGNLIEVLMLDYCRKIGVEVPEDELGPGDGVKRKTTKLRKE
jgi:hypothetical protein